MVASRGRVHRFDSITGKLYQFENSIEDLLVDRTGASSLETWGGLMVGSGGSRNLRLTSRRW